MNRIALTTALGLAFASSLAAFGSLAIAQQPAPAAGQQPPAPIERPHDGPRGPRGQHKPDPHRQAMMLSRRLNLTPEQTAKIEPVLADREQKMEALHANTALSPQDMHTQMKAIHEQERSQFASILTPEQQEQMKAMRRRGGPGGPGGPGRFRGQTGTTPSGI